VRRTILLYITKELFVLD